MKKICVIGTGYVGLASGVCLAEIGHSVICVDNNKEKIDQLKKVICPIYEPGLEKLMAKNKKRLYFTTDIKDAVLKSDIIFIAVHTPTREDGETDLQFVENVSKEIALVIDKYKVIVSKSTMPVKTGQKIKEIISKFCKKGVEFDVVSNPEFLKEGTAIDDFLRPDRIVIGVESKKAEKIMRSIYSPIKAPLIFTSIESAEIIKHSCNAFLATKISFINTIANICEKNNANVEEVALAMGLDKRIGKHFLKAGIGFGGSCFPKDVSAFINVAEKSGYDFDLLREVKKINKQQRYNFIETVKDKILGFKNKKIAVLGLSFKPDTDDMREAPSIDIISSFLDSGAEVRVFDPVAIENAKKIFKDKIYYAKDIYDVANGCDVLIILTEWQEFYKMNLKRIKKLLKKPIIIDGRNIFEPKKMEKLGFKYYSIGR
ncbi:MAG: UDP-glucose 6-dehydrogenase [Candidatus Staskawiczbacteria bacterium RIFOXYB2_FULL_32_9]|uniref:UDP-glucose 6-dehydrogenase n=1 Tax=Candidatus Staskawiczbacteria bacterium RIFOXYD1_FULL_32_13 TaxID=1802234 RepID=A0A1G2JQE1_9BACT|nr:MAG: Nucleotide sugar dehydrogenase [Parcubacteria group bacterium GW2011_GWC2_32_10]OGZ78559.1 MAG: UDP-glucose 6-dehydrogenase [Candidatus Staskawiczbacteria bacterium RIFOXYA2_FULL_32_7]OGZ79184.1 MAG: UDP-glucose 6-dehydrogenase [Candidatus Staskawiczbacteria bacterium RIFOXYB1_FULL_32_11]OGZ81236.1 MAG: UDP-glucose 6-dehydrogenase [Candidatus Staskawiczbacteria bacterium RIFOXYB2_FULL_32_9]OGZ85027.1 MAG: UDP-glucose 6-dehydrogenase [Candidatus Staskawiczbacteria bacterium RIFOXYC2_FULL